MSEPTQQEPKEPTTTEPPPPPPTTTTPTPVLCRACKAGERDGFFVAVQKNHIDCLRLLLQRGKADVNANDNSYHATALGWALHLEHDALAQLLLAAHADIDGDPHTSYLIQMAARDNNTTFLERLVAMQQPDLLEFILFKAIEELSIQSVMFAVEKGVNVNCRRDVLKNKEMTPLLLAAHKSFFQAARVLLEAGADVELVDGNNKTALMYACQQGAVQVMELLMMASADPHKEDVDGNTATLLLSRTRNVWLVKQSHRQELSDYVANYNHTSSYILK